MLGVGDPRAHPAFDFPARHRSPAPPVAQAPQAVAEATHVPFGQAAPAAGQEDEAEELRRLLRLHDHGLAPMEAQAAAFQEPGEAEPPVLEAFGVVVEEREVVHVAQVAPGSQDLLAEVVQAVGVDIGEELAGQVADGQAAPALERSEQVAAGVVEARKAATPGFARLPAAACRAAVRRAGKEAMASKRSWAFRGTVVLSVQSRLNGS